MKIELNTRILYMMLEEFKQEVLDDPNLNVYNSKAYLKILKMNKNNIELPPRNSYITVINNS